MKSADGVELCEDDTASVGVAPGDHLAQMDKRAVRFSHASSEESIREAARRLGGVMGEGIR